MKKIIISAFLLFALSLQAQEKNILISQEFWQSKPTLSTVKEEVKKGFDFKNVQGSDDPIVFAMNNNADKEIIKFLIDQPDVNLSRTIHEGRIYLHTSVSKNLPEITDYLIKKGSDVNFLDANGHTPASFCAFNGTLTPEVLEVLRKNGLDLNKKYETKDNANLLLLSIGYDKDFKLTDYLLKQGLSLSSSDKFGNGIFFYAARIGNTDILKELIKRGVKYNDTALIAAAQGTYRSANSVEVYKFLIDDLKLNSKVVTLEGQTLLHLVTKKTQNQDEVISYLLSKGTDATIVDKDGNTAFISAAGGKNLEIVKTLFEKTKNINVANNNGDTAFINAVKIGSASVLEFLINSGADLSVIDKNGYNAAFILVDAYKSPRGRGGMQNGTPNKNPQQGRENAHPTQRPQNGEFGGQRGNQSDDFVAKLKLLQTKGIDFGAVAKDGKTVFHIAAAKNDLNLMKNLSSVKTNINAKDKDGNTALHKATLVAKDDQILKLLISLGADKNVKTEFGETAYDLAKENEFLTKNNISIDFLK